MSHTSKERTQRYRDRQKSGVWAVIPVALMDESAWLLQELGYLHYPANSKQEIGDAVSELLQAIERLPAETKVTMRKLEHVQ